MVLCFVSQVDHYVFFQQIDRLEALHDELLQRTEGRLLHQAFRFLCRQSVLVRNSLIFVLRAFIFETIKLLGPPRSNVYWPKEPQNGTPAESDCCKKGADAILLSLA